MKLTKTVGWQTKDGRNIEVRIERTRKVANEVAYADGWNVDLGKKTIDRLDIEMFVDGQYVGDTDQTPSIITEQFDRSSYARLRAAGAYARLGNTYITEEQYNLITAAIKELETELTSIDDREYDEVKAQETAEANRQAEAQKALEARVERLRQSGLCPKCGTWCYGDCEANR